MTEEHCCPVCERQGLVPECECCPQCDADLTCFQALDRLHTENTVPEKKEDAGGVTPGRFAGIALFASVFSGVIALAVLSFIMGRFDKRLAGQNNHITAAIHGMELQQNVSTTRLRIRELKVHHEASLSRMEAAVKNNRADIMRIDARLNNLEEELDRRVTAVLSNEKKLPTDSIPSEAVTEIEVPPVSARTFLYHTRKTDTLWAIARRFYGDGKYYPLIMEQNPHLLISDITEGQEVRILAEPDPKMLAETYRRKTEWKKGMLLFKYVVQPEDTRDSIYARFAAPGATGKLFFDTGADIVPFNTIRIILQ